MKLRFTIRELLWLAALVALSVGWWADHNRMARTIDQLSLLVQPASTIEGRVVYGDTGKPAAGVKVHAQAISAFAAGRRAGGRAITDDEGRYKFINLAPANFNVYIEPPEGWTASAIESLPVTVGQAVKANDVRLVEGGFIHGRVVDDRTGSFSSLPPNLRTDIGVYGPARPKTSPGVERVLVDAQGEFKIRVPAGRNFPYIMSLSPADVVKGPDIDEGVMVEDGKTTEVQFNIRVPPPSASSSNP
jgi:hypothetical protein